MELSARELALYLACTALDKGGERLAVLVLPGARALFDAVVLVDGRSERQVATLVDEALHFCKRHGIAHVPVEGEGGWRVLDCHSVIYHAFLPDIRDYYRLEELWPEAEIVPLDEDLAKLPRLPVAG